MPPGLSIENCPEHIRENPLPHERCSAPVEDYRKPPDRFTRLSIFADFDFHIPWDRYRMSLGGTFRPIHHFGLGAEVEWNFDNQVDVLGRISLDFETQNQGMRRISFTGLAGLQHLYGSPRDPASGGPSEAVSGNLLTLGLEVAYDVRVFRWLGASIFAGIRYTPSAEVQATADPARTVELDHDITGMLGIRISGDFFNAGALK